MDLRLAISSRLKQRQTARFFPPRKDNLQLQSLEKLLAKLSTSQHHQNNFRKYFRVNVTWNTWEAMSHGASTGGMAECILRESFGHPFGKLQSYTCDMFVVGCFSGKDRLLVRYSPGVQRCDLQPSDM